MFNKDINEITTLIAQKQESLNIYEYTISKYKDYYKFFNDREDFPKKIKVLERNVNIWKNKCKKREELLKLVLDKISNQKDGILRNLIESLKGINGYVKSNQYKGVCPVCSTKKGDALIEILEANQFNFTKILMNQTKYADKLLDLKTSLNNRIEVLKQNIKLANNEISNLKSRVLYADQQLNKIKLHKNFISEMFIQEWDSLIKKSRDLKNEILILDELISNKLKIKELEGEFGVFKKLVVGRRSKEELRKELDLLVRVNRRLNSYFDRIKKYRLEVSNEIEYLRGEYKNLIQILDREEIQKDFTKIISRLEDEIILNEKKIELIQITGKMLSSLEANTKIENQIQELQYKRNELQAKIGKIESTIDEISSFMQLIFKDFRNHIKDYLNSWNSPIQRYYRYLNPLPSNSYLKFEGEDEKLWVRIQFLNNENLITNTAKNILSSGQLNVLAIAIFLAINHSQNIHELDFVGIDDPIQNMDDINQFSICDVLSSIEKQLIFSTHDLDFLKLFLKKNSHRAYDIQVYRFLNPYLESNNVEHLIFNS